MSVSSWGVDELVQAYEAVRRALRVRDAGRAAAREGVVVVESERLVFA